MTNRNETAGEATRKAIIASMRQGREYTCGDIVTRTGLPKTGVIRNMGTLVTMGLVDCTGDYKSYKIYRLATAEVTA